MDATLEQIMGEVINLAIQNAQLKAENKSLREALDACEKARLVPGEE